LTGILAGVKNGEFQGRPDVTLTLESGDDNVMVSVPEDLSVGVVADLTPKIGADVQIPCIVTIQTGKNGPYMRWRMRAIRK
jgi:hypothetical protein